MAPLLTFEDTLVAGRIVDRPNRFVVRVRFAADRDPERAYLGDPGELADVLEHGREILCSPVDDPERSTAHDAIAVRVGGTYVSLRAALANDLFEQVLRRGLVPAFDDHELQRREPALPDHGRTDFLLEGPTGRPTYVEVKSCTHVDDGVATFPDRPTARGRRHLESLVGLVDDGADAHVVFVVQRPDVDRFRPYRAVDPEFADVLARASTAGVGVHAIATAFEPPDYRLSETNLPIDRT